MRQLNPEKLANLSSFNRQLDEEYGKPGNPQREEFHEEALSWYYGQLLRDRRRELKMTQREVAEKLGREQSYIARVERGKAEYTAFEFFPHCRSARYSVYTHVFKRDEIVFTKWQTNLFQRQKQPK